MKKISFLILLLSLTTIAFAKVSLPYAFSDHMVLQRNKPIQVWGWAAAGEKVSVSFAGQTQQTVADKTGNWKVVLQALKEGGPYEMKITGAKNKKEANEIVFKDILMGDVWVCSGQSNMDFNMRGIENPAQEAAVADYPSIRQLKIYHRTSLTPSSTLTKTEWKVCNPTNVADFTAVGYFFAKKLYHELNVPIGLITSTYGGTNIEAWTSNDGLKQNPYFNKILADNAQETQKVVESRVQKIKDAVKMLQGDLDISDIAKWREPNYNDANWPTLNVPQYWEEQGLPGFDGVGWYRKTIQLTQEQAEKATNLMLAKIDDIDRTFINGVQVGGSKDYAALRNYTIPQNLLKAGANTIAVEVTDGAGNAGIYGNKEDVKLVFNGLSNMDLSGRWKFKADASNVTMNAIKPNAYPSTLFNAMIYPVLNFAVSGVIWYQGENNTSRGKQYGEVFPLLIKDWRNQFKQPDMGFYFVQLASFDASGGKANGTTGSFWAELRDAQKSALALPYTGMAVASDIGNAKDIHPKNKKDVGIRLALNALKTTYGKDIVPAGPLYQSVQFADGKAVVSFSNVGCGLMVRNHDVALKGFQIAGADKVFHWAKAKITGDKVTVYSDEVKNPAAVRYGWTDVLDDINLYNKENLPASPFRTDDWYTLGEKNKYKIFTE